MEHGSHVAQTAFMARHASADSQSHHHEPDLGNGGKGQHPLDVALHASHGSGIESRESPDVGHNVQRFRRVCDIKREHPCHLVHSGHDHRGRMNQRTDRRRAFHSVGQPDVEREHGALTGTAHKHQPQCPRQHQCALHKVLLGRRKGERTHIITVNQDTDKESEVGKTCHDKSFLGSGDGFRLCIIKPDEQVRGHAHQFPKHIHLENVRGYHQPEHRKGEQAQESVITLKTLLPFHIPERIDVHHERNGGNNHQHHHRNRIEQNTHVDMQAGRKGKPHEIIRYQGSERPVGQARQGEITVCRDITQHGYRSQ